jgi:hypothetical protein
VTLPLSPQPQPFCRLIPSRFPPVGLFDTVATAADMEAAMELAGWTNDRLVAERIARLPPEEWVYGRANASIVMAAFLHASPTGARFNGPDLGAWYAAADVRTSAAEVGHHLRREAAARHVPKLSRVYRAYSARLDGDHVDIRGLKTEMPELCLPSSYAASQSFGEARRKAGDIGILYDSVRLMGGINSVTYRPGHIVDMSQADHFDITVDAGAKRIDIRRLAAP